MKFVSMLLAATLLALSASGAAYAQRVEHFKGKKAETLTEAVANFLNTTRSLPRFWRNPFLHRRTC